MEEKEAVKYQDDNIIVIEDDIERIREVGGMYIGYMGHKGAMHLAKELIANHTDEGINENSPADLVKIFLDQKTNTLITQDNGRAIPHDKLIVTCTKVQSSSKIRRGGTSGTSAGQNGVGLTACAALAEYFESISVRDGIEASYKVLENQPIGDEYQTKKAKKDERGQSFILKPSAYFLDKEDDPAIFPRDMLEEWIFNLSHAVPPKIKMEFTVIDEEGKTSKKKYANTDGMLGLLKHYHKGKIIEPVHFHDILYYKENIKGEEVEKYTGLELAFSYDPLSTDDFAMSFCNTLRTPEGTHEDAVRGGIIQVLQELATKALTENQAKTISIISKDVLRGIKIYVNVFTTSDPDFTGQIKEKVGSPLLYKKIRPMVVRNLRKIMKENEKLAKKFTDVIKASARMRTASEVELSAITKTSRSHFLDQHKINRFIPSDVDDDKVYSELYIVEGDSAGESMRSPRVRLSYQAVVYLQGMSMNSYKNSLKEIMDNNELRTIVRVIGAGIGDSFDVKKSKFNKIVISTDADSDGKYISSSLAMFFLRWMRPLVEAGMVYINMSPLYRLVDKEHRYVRDKQEYFDIYVKNVNKELKIGNKKTGMMSKDEVRDLLINNRDYIDEMERLIKYFGVHRDILEFVVFHVGDKDFLLKMKKRFPELRQEGKLILGVYEGEYQVLKLGKQFFKRCATLNELAFQKNNPAIYFTVFDRKEKELSERGEMTLGQLLLLCSNYRPKIDERFKGLGEFDAEELREQVLNPANRKLVCLSIVDLEKATEVIDTFFGDNPAKRKAELAGFHIRRDELDN